MSTQANLVRLVAEYRGGERERLWAELVRPGVARVLSISHYSDLSNGDLVKVSPLCSCDEEHEHYEMGHRVFRASRRVQFFTTGTDEVQLERVRHWGAAYHVAGGRGLPSRWYAAFDIVARPVRLRLVQSEHDTSERDTAEAAADDLWDAVAVVWQFVKWAGEQRLDSSPALEHVVAELHAAGRWLAGYPVVVAAHDRAVAALFDGETRATL